MADPTASIRMATQNPNIAVIVLDTLRKDAFDTHFEWLDGVSYENAWSTARWTVPAHASLFTGRYGSEVNSHAKRGKFEDDTNLIAELLGRNGYTTRAFSANIQISSFKGFDQGFDHFYHTDVPNVDGFDWFQFIKENQTTGIKKYLSFLRNVYASDARFFPLAKWGVETKLKNTRFPSSRYDSGAREIVKEIKNTDFSEHNEFLFVNLMESHSPYIAPEEYQTVTPQTVDAPYATVANQLDVDPDSTYQSYIDCVRYLSDRYKELFRYLSKRFDYIITLSDHGESFGEDGIWGHFCGVQPATAHIPLVINSFTEKKTPHHTKNAVSIVDVHQTICDLADCNTPGRGESLLGEHSGQSYVVETSGMSVGTIKNLKKRSVSKDKIQKYDCVCYGTPTSSGYTYQKPSGGVDSHGQPIEDFDTSVDCLTSELGYEETDESVEDIPAKVQRRLEDLGYA